MDNEKKQKLTKWKNEPTLEDLKYDLNGSRPYQRDAIDNIREWRKLLNAECDIKTHKNKSKAQPKLIRKQAEWRYPQLEDPFLNTDDMFTIKPRTAEDVNAAKQNQLVLNYQWSAKVNRNKIVTDTARSLYDDGTVIVKTGWEFEEKEIVEIKDVPIYASPEDAVKFLSAAVKSGKISQEHADEVINRGIRIKIGSEPKKVKTRKVIKNQPTYEVRDIENIIIDSTARGDISKANFIIDEYETTFSDLKKDEYKIVEEFDNDGNVINKHSVGYYKNLDEVKAKILSNKNDTNPVELSSDEEKDLRPSFNMKDIARKKIKAYDYWGYWDINKNNSPEIIVATWVEDVLVRLEKNPYPFDELPFSVAQYMPDRDSIYGTPDAELLKEDQKSIGQLTRAAHDIIAEQAIGQTLIDEFFFASPLQKRNYENGNTAYFRSGKDPRASIYKKNADQIPNSIFNMIDFVNNDAESLTGTRAFAQGVGSKSLGNVAAGIRESSNAASQRLLSILRRLAVDIFVDIARKTIKMNNVFLEEQEVVRISDDEFVAIDRDSLKGEFDLIVKIDTPEQRNEKAQQLTTLMQTNAASMDPKLQTMIYAKIANLWGEKDLAKEIENYQPQPDPAQVQLQKLQLENAMLENQRLKIEIAKTAKDIESENSKIEERISRIAQNLNSETAENKAKARLENAKAGLIETQIDEKKLNIDNMKSGKSLMESQLNKQADFVAQNEIEKLKHKHQIELEALRSAIKLKEKELDLVSSSIDKMADAVQKGEPVHLTIAEIQNKKMMQHALDNMNKKHENGVRL